MDGPVAAAFISSAVLEFFRQPVVFFALAFCCQCAGPRRSSQTNRQLVLLIWGLLFFAYMHDWPQGGSLPVPLAIPW